MSTSGISRRYYIPSKSFRFSFNSTPESLIQGFVIQQQCGALTRHWTPASQNGFCEMSLLCSETLEDIPHILQWCPALSNVRHSLLEFTQRFSSNLPPDLFNLIRENCHPESPNLLSSSSLRSSAHPSLNQSSLSRELGSIFSTESG